jgi:hypothetical protein
MKAPRFGVAVQNFTSLVPLLNLRLAQPSPLVDVGGLPGVGNAVSDALGRCVEEVPLTPRRVWELARSPARAARPPRASA